MSEAVIVNFQISLRLPITAENATMIPSSYWGITVAKKPTAKRDPFADQQAFVRLVEGAAARAAGKAVAENDALGIPTPVRGKDNTVVYRLRGKLVKKDR